MRALVIYESMFGNTQAVAEAIAAGMATHGQVNAYEVSQAPTTLPDDLDLLIVGGPTHAFGLSRPATRADAATKTLRPLVSPAGGIREWLDALTPQIRRVTAAAAFDTKMSKPRWLPGSAARAISKRLKDLGFSRAAMPASFYVESMTGPLSPAELARAEAWAASIVATWNARQRNLQVDRSPS